MESQASATVDKDGFASFDIYHCSSYVVLGSVLEGAVNHFGETGAVPAGADISGEAGKASAGIDASSADAFDLSAVVLVAVLAATAMLTFVLTMLVFKVGVFKKKLPAEEAKRNSGSRRL